MAAVAVILPCYGRHEQTLEYATRMRRKAGVVISAEWWAVGGGEDAAIVRELRDAGWAHWVGDERLTYWQALANATKHSHAPILCAVANDVWAGEGWLQLGLEAYRERFADGEGLLGFAGDGHGPTHSCHFLIGRRLLAHLGGWPQWFVHNFGDTELCLRAQALGRYAKATRAILEHRHVWHGTAPDDEVYAKGRLDWERDQALFEQRKAAGWPPIQGS